MAEMERQVATTQLKTVLLTPEQMMRLLEERTAQLNEAQAAIRQQQKTMAVQAQQLAKAAVPIGGAKPNKPEMYAGQRDPVVLEAWKHQVWTSMQLLRGLPAQQVVLASTFLRAQVVLWWLERQLAIAQGTAKAYATLDEFFKGLSNQFVPRAEWQLARDKLANFYQRGSIQHIWRSFSQHCASYS